MGRRSHTRVLSAWINGQRVGQWRLLASGETEFIYDVAWISSPGGRPLSLSMPLVKGPLKGPSVRNYFDNLLPDSVSIRERLAAHFRTQTTGAFDLLQAIGRDCVGAVQLLGEDEMPHDVETIQGKPLGPEDVEQLLLQTVDSGAWGSRMEEDELRISLAGAQEKTALLWHDQQWVRPHGATPTTHILKLPMGLVGHRKADFGTSVENEWLCLNILAQYGLPVPRSAILVFGTQKVLAVERFDRRLHTSGQWLMRLPQEDFCQALGLPSHLKYEADGGPGLVDLAKVLRHSIASQVDLATLLTTQILFWLLAAPDGHAKNFSIHLLPQGRFRLTPLYDVMSIWPVEGKGPNQFSRFRTKLAMGLAGKSKHYLLKDIQRRHFNTMASRCFHGPDAEALIQNVIALTPRVIERVGSTLPAGFPQQVADTIFQGLMRSVELLDAMPPN